jgi:hypothetical protein
MARLIRLSVSVAVVAAVAATLGALPARSQTTTTVGAHGELYTVETGLYGDLFPEQSLADADNASLALDITRPGLPLERLLVPGTGTGDFEDTASLVFDDGSDTLFILWQTKINLIHSKLDLVSFHDGEWSPVIEIWGSPFGWKTAPQLAVTRDQFVTETDDGGTRAWARTVVHVIWAEDGTYGPNILYSPIILLDGEFTGSSPVYSLTELANLGDQELSGGVEPALSEAPRIQAGRNGQTVVIGFTDAASGRLVTLELEVLPGEVSYLADRGRRQLIGIGHKLKVDPTVYVDEIRRQLIGIGRRIDLHPGVAMYAADVAVDDIMQGHSDEDVAAVADGVRRQIIAVGARMTDRGVDRTLPKTGYSILDLSTGEDPTSDRGADLIRVSTVANLPAPTVGDPSATISLYLSRSGDSVIVAWPEGDRLTYRESVDGDWGDLLQLVIGSPGVPSLERAQEMLRRRAENQHARVE